MTDKSTISPFVKWVGGKRQLIPAILERMPKEFNKYYEPFIGGGGVILSLIPDAKSATINDINPVLINAYRTVKTDCDTLINLLADMDAVDCSKERYYELRSRFNYKIENKEFDAEMAALFIFINKHCFNGLYRVNSKGLFNVPYNGKVTGRSFDPDNIRGISKYLDKVTILNGDFADAVKDAGEGDFVFFDSPYAPLNPTSFESYTKEGFAIEQHERLAALFKELDKRGCKLMLTNHNTELINALYKDYTIDVVQVRRAINSDATKRSGEEVIITNGRRKGEVC